MTSVTFDQSPTVTVSAGLLKLEWESAGGGLVSISDSAGGELLRAKDGSQLRLVVGGTPGLNRVGQGPDDQLRVQVNAETHLIPSEMGVRKDATVVGTRPRLVAVSRIDTGVGTRIDVTQSVAGWEWTVSYLVDHLLPVVTLDIGVSAKAADAPALNAVEWWMQTGAFQRSILGSTQTVDGNGVYFENDAGGFILSRFHDGDFGRWTTAADDDHIAFVLHLGTSRPGLRSVSGGGFRLTFGADADDAVQSVRLFNVRSRITALPDRPQWADGAIYETFVGVWPESPRFPAYAPYPHVADLVADLPRIRRLGFGILYVMPRDPFPSYTTASFSDLDLQYGDGPNPATPFAELVRAAHAHGLRVIVDVVLHGVLDQAALEVQRARRAYAGKIAEKGTENWDVWKSLNRDDWHTYEVAHEAGWSPLAPAVHPYHRDHPEWFGTLPDGRTQVSYTKSFDLRHPGLREFVSTTLSNLLADPGLDGFRFDAPAWNYAAYRWAEDAGYRASWSTEAGAALIRDVWGASREVKPDSLMFAESADVTQSTSGHMQYPYDEQPTLNDLLGGAITAEQARHRFHHIASMRAVGIVTAHWVDAHDSAWWPDEGRKWRRQIHGVPALKAGTVLMAMMGGAFMMFGGGEREIEDLLTRVLKLRQDDPVLRLGSVHEIAVTCDNPAVFPLLRRSGSDWRLVVVNFSHDKARARLLLPEWATGSVLNDILDGIADVTVKAGAVELSLDSFQAAVFRPAMPVPGGR